MLRYLAISAIIVVGATAIVAAYADRDFLRIKIASVYAKVSPKTARAEATVTPNAQALTITAPWALSALPACLTQMSDTTGPPAYVRAHLPTGSQPIVPPAVLRYGNCTILVRGDEAYVIRGDDRFTIPPPVQFFRTAEGIAVLRRDGAGMDLRVYQSAPGATNE
ncbi:MAG TPA: hypothetical protein VMF61_08360 [Candidatus Acidoferrales bacterium]|nr:hypothetical protein [Candidatus Acidoferrales bacterium]